MIPISRFGSTRVVLSTAATPPVVSGIPTEIYIRSPVTIMNRTAHHVEPDGHVYIDPDNDSVLDSYGHRISPSTSYSGACYMWPSGEVVSDYTFDYSYGQKRSPTGNYLGAFLVRSDGTVGGNINTYDSYGNFKFL